MAIDMANFKDRIAVEFDGPYHYLGLNGRIENGKTKLKLRMLRKLNWKVINIPWFEWKDVCEKGKPERIKFLKGKLSA